MGNIYLGDKPLSSLYFPISNSVPTNGNVVQIVSSSYTNGATWPAVSGSESIVVYNNPLVGSGSNGKWQFSGGTLIAGATPDYLVFSSSLFTNKISGDRTQPFTILFNGTLNIPAPAAPSFGTGLFGNPFYNENPSGSDIIARIDNSPGAGRAFIDMRGRQAAGGDFARFNVAYVSGTLYNFAFVKDINENLSVYQNGNLVATTSSLSWAGGYTLFNTSSGIYGGFTGLAFGIAGLIGTTYDTEAYNGQLGAISIYNRALADWEISQSAMAYNGVNKSVRLVDTVYLGSEVVLGTPTPTTTTTSTTTTTTSTTTTTTSTTTTSTTTRPPLSVLSLVVGGGGAGGVGTAGGGGAGGLRTGSFSLTASTYTVTVGNGGASSAGPVGLNASTQSGNPGQTSSFSTILVAFGGGGGMAYEGTQNTSNGGSGGGPSDTRINVGGNVNGGVGTPNQGFGGGSGSFGQQFGAGGGGASQVGQNGNGAPNPKIAGAGGSGSANTFRDGTSIFYAGGGGAAGYNTALGGAGGRGGGGAGGGPSGGAGVTGSRNTGGGGGGSNRNVNGTVNGVGAGGGSGIVVIAYLTSSFSASIVTAVSGGIITDFTSGSQVYRSHTFLSSSNLVVS